MCVNPSTYYLDFPSDSMLSSSVPFIFPDSLINSFPSCFVANLLTCMSNSSPACQVAHPPTVAVTQARPPHASKNGRSKEKGKDQASDTCKWFRCLWKWELSLAESTGAMTSTA